MGVARSILKTLKFSLFDFILISIALFSAYSIANKLEFDLLLGVASPASLTFIIVILALSYGKFKFSGKILNRPSLFFSAFVFPVVLMLPFLSWHPIWAEESGWLSVVVRIRNGMLFDPFIAKSDFPSSIAAWPILPFYWLSSDIVWSSRLVGVLYLAGGLYYLCRILHLLTGIKERAVHGILFPLTSVSLVFTALSGWHEISPVPLLIFSQWYYLLCVLWESDNQPDDSAPVYFAFWSALGVWTLYTPLIFSLGLWLIFILSKASIENKRSALVVLIAMVLPLIGEIAQTKGGLVARHKIFLLDGGEVRSALWSGAKSVSAAYWISIRGIFEHFLIGSPEYYYKAALLVAPKLGPLPGLFALLGATMIVLKWRTRGLRLLILPGIISFIGVVVSNPGNSIWRESILLMPIMLWAGLGLVWLGSFARQTRQRYLNIALFGLIAAAQALYVTPQFQDMFSYFEHPSQLGRLGVLARNIVSCMEAENLVGDIIYPDNLLANFADALLGRSGGSWRYTGMLEFIPGDSLTHEQSIVITSNHELMAPPAEIVWAYIKGRHPEAAKITCSVKNDEDIPILITVPRKP